MVISKEILWYQYHQCDTNRVLHLFIFYSIHIMWMQTFSCVKCHHGRITLDETVQINADRVRPLNTAKHLRQRFVPLLGKTWLVVKMKLLRELQCEAVTQIMPIMGSMRPHSHLSCIKFWKKQVRVSVCTDPLPGVVWKRVGNKQPWLTKVNHVS